MWIFLTIFGSSFIITLWMTPFSIWLSKSINALDYPDAKLKTHKNAMPYLGGFAIFGGFSFSIILSYIFKQIEFNFIISLLIGSFLILLIGFFDDKYNIKSYKFIAQIAVGLIIALLGIQSSFLSNQFLNAMLVVSIVVITCNSLNLIDGVDGLASGVVTIASAFFFILFAISNNIVGMIISLGLLGSVFAFLIFNFSPATIYLGNNGSLFLGLIIAVLTIIFPTSKNVNLLLAPFIIFAIPIADVVLALIRRIINHRSLLSGDRSHFYDHLLRYGLPQKKMILIVYMICIFLGGIAILMSLMPLGYCLMFLFAITLCFTVITIKMKFYQIVD